VTPHGHLAFFAEQLSASRRFDAIEHIGVAFKM
jgi:hypothetical protein